MAKVAIWWLGVALVLTLPLMARYDARNTFAASNSQELFVGNMRKVLETSDLHITGQITDVNSDNKLIGYSFADASCPQDLKVVAFSAAFVSHSYASDFASDNDAVSYHYHDQQYEGVSRLSVALTWARTLLENAVSQGNPKPVRFQVAVIRPQACQAHQLDWAAMFNPINDPKDELKS